MSFPSPAADYAHSRIDLNHVCKCTDPSVRMFVAERSHGMGIVSGTILLIDASIKPAHGNIVLASINGDLDVWRLCTINRHGLELLVDTETFIHFGNEFIDDEVQIEGVVTFIIYDAKNDVFDDTPCI